jgi:hypothetical protein
MQQMTHGSLLIYAPLSAHFWRLPKSRRQTGGEVAVRSNCRQPG